MGTRKRLKRDNTGGLPEWFVRYLKTGKHPVKNLDDAEYWGWSHFRLLAGTKINGIEFEDTDTAKKRRLIAEKLGI